MPYVQRKVDRQTQPDGRDDVGQASKDQVCLPRVFLQEINQASCFGPSGGLHPQESAVARTGVVDLCRQMAAHRGAGSGLEVVVPHCRSLRGASNGGRTIETIERLC